MKNAVGIDQCYNHGIRVMPFFNMEGVDIYEGVIERLTESVNAPSIIIGRLPRSVSERYKLLVLFWNFSDERDLDSVIMKQYPIWEKLCLAMRCKADVILTVKDEEKTIEKEKEMLLSPYVANVPYGFDRVARYGVNYIEDDMFLKFVYDVLGTAARYWKK